ncbi:MAG: hydroxyacylglutathione hydrolase [Aestuariivita sp.]|nr:hydroxyacylglutathione hydrolase [Aestuariivita sp.]
MPFKIVTIPCLSDNYAFLAHEPKSGHTALIDIPESKPILQTLDKHGWSLNHVLITHHHADHVDGLDAVRTAHPEAKVVGAKSDRARLPKLDIEVSEGDHIHIGDETGTILDVPGHTMGHIAYYFRQAQVAFTADSLMALGCGRVFEGTMPQMWQSLQKLAQLPPETLICSGHEYTQSNGAFAITIDPDNPELQARIAEIARQREENTPTVPSRLSQELKTNPFLRATDPKIQRYLGLDGSAPADVFAEIRRRKDHF